MPQFMILLTDQSSDVAQRPPLEMQSLIEGHSAYEKSLRARSAYRDGERLRPSTEGCRVRNRDGEVQVDSGPFPEPPLTGYYVLEAESLDAALALAEGCPLAAGAELEVRPLEGGRIEPDKSSKQGRVFAFAVLGSADREEGWTQVMDRIAGCSRQDFANVTTLGGVRLKAPSLGRRVRTSGASRVVFDGPFLESKEVIGGLLFMRFSSMQEAVAFARGTEFVKHGAVEIRELWRS